MAVVFVQIMNVLSVAELPSKQALGNHPTAQPTNAELCPQGSPRNQESSSFLKDFHT